MAQPPYKMKLPVITLIEVEPGVYEFPKQGSAPVLPIDNTEPLYLKLDNDFGKAGKALFDLYTNKPGAREQALVDLLNMFFK